ncbi:hypothetical protein J8273_0614 [Carpediemonas membranifera]|uniref:Uncharacterized protein n=1 Tax=Carpediemonas membranifera TaxID=201153 RepID=A0A8J6BBS3_9EUKA|nr:hypothetical protein J8273_0614 [Carpediemonas membranifera]|eukprot:KAG9397484.1 hypothetical protein J8273_0614 [Carpediemonas membranifera]
MHEPHSHPSHSGPPRPPSEVTGRHVSFVVPSSPPPAARIPRQIPQSPMVGIYSLQTDAVLDPTPRPHVPSSHMTKASMVAMLRHHMSAPPPAPPVDDVEDLIRHTPSRTQARVTVLGNIAQHQLPMSSFTEWSLFQSLIGAAIELPDGWVRGTGIYYMDATHLQAFRYVDRKEVSELPVHVVFGKTEPNSVTGVDSDCESVLVTKKSPNELLIAEMEALFDSVTPFTPQKDQAPLWSKYITLARYIGGYKGINPLPFLERRFQCLWLTKRGFTDIVDRQLKNEDTIDEVLGRGPIDTRPKVSEMPSLNPQDAGAPLHMDRLLGELFSIIGEASSPAAALLQQHGDDTAIPSPPRLREPSRIAHTGPMVMVNNPLYQTLPRMYYLPSSAPWFGSTVVPLPFTPPSPTIADDPLDLPEICFPTVMGELASMPAYALPRLGYRH